MVQAVNEARAETIQSPSSDAEAIRLSTADLRVVVPEDRRRRVTNVVVQAIMNTPAGVKIDRHKLLQTLDHNFDALCDGTEFDLAPILDALLRVPGVTEEELYVGITNVIGLLASMEITAREPLMSLDGRTRSRLLDEASRHSEDARVSFEAGHTRQTLTAFRRQKLGELLIKHGLIDRPELDEALAAQAEIGGRLGTNLVELGHISESELTQFLSLQLDLPSMDTNEINSIPVEAIACISPETAAKHQVIPIMLERHQVHVAMVDPTNLEAIDEVSFITGKRVLPVVAPEFVVSYALERYYNIRRAPRFVPNATSRRSARPDNLFFGGHNASAGLDLGLDDDTVEGPAPPMLVGSDQFRPADAYAEPPPAERVASARPEAGMQAEPASDSAASIAGLADARDEAEVYATLERLLAEDYRRYAVFELDGTSVSKWHPYTGTIPIRTGQRASIVAQEHPVLGWVVSTGKPYSGAIVPEASAASPERDWLADALCTTADAEILCAPILRHGRVAALIAASDPVGMFESEGVGAYQRIAFLTGSALEMVSLRRAIVNAANAIPR